MPMEVANRFKYERAYNKSLTLKRWVQKSRFLCKGDIWGGRINEERRKLGERLSWASREQGAPGKEILATVGGQLNTSFLP